MSLCGVLINCHSLREANENCLDLSMEISVYDPLDYPDATSGNVREILVPPKTEVYIDLDAIIFDSTEVSSTTNLARKLIISWVVLILLV